MVLYAGYGSHLDPRRPGERIPDAAPPRPGWLVGWRLAFGGEHRGWEGALATVVEDPAERVFVLIHDLDDLDEQLLDSWLAGSLGLYRKIRVPVRPAGGGQVLAWLHGLDHHSGGLPSARYLATLADAASAAGAPEDYLARLRRQACAPAAMEPA